MSHKIPGGFWESLGAELFTVDNRHYLCIVHYHSKFPVIKQVGGFNTDNLIKTCMNKFSEYGLPSEIVADAGKNFISEKFENFCS